MDANYYSFFGFISYSRKDKRIADWLLAKLESYAYPADLVGEYQRPPHNKYIRPIFLDTQNLQVEERPFTEKLKENLRRSKFLLVICSNNSAKSPFVNMEIEYFLETHDRNYSLVVPLFVDEVEGCVPPAFDHTSIMERHFPIYNTVLGEKSEANEYCFVQFASYLLGIDFSSVFNRYEERARRNRKKRTRQMLCLIGGFVVLLMSLSYNIYYQGEILKRKEEVIEKKEKLITFERNVFPRAVVYGYEENFLRPVIHYLKETGKPLDIHIVLPKTERELRHHQNRVIDAKILFKQKLQIDSIGVITLPTYMKRGSKIMALRKQGAYFDGTIIDFATITSSFIKVAEYKKENEAYNKQSLSEIIEGYSLSFIEQTKEVLERDSVYVHFYLSTEDLVRALESDRR